MKLVLLVLAAVLTWHADIASADTSYASRLELVDALRFRTARPDLDGPVIWPGQWLTDGTNDATFRARDVIGYEPDPSTGAPVAQWGNLVDGIHHRAGGGLRLGMGSPVTGLNSTTGFGTETTGHAAVFGLAISSSLQRRDNVTDARTIGFWERDFLLDAHGSFTFAARAALAVAGDTSALQAEFHAADTSFADGVFLSLRDVWGRVSAGIGASLFGAGGQVTHTTGPDGLLSLTITNHGDTPLAGRLNAEAFSVMRPLASPVPEPAVWMSMLLGCGAVGVGVGRRRRVAVVSARPRLEHVFHRRQQG